MIRKGYNPTKFQQLISWFVAYIEVLMPQPSFLEAIKFKLFYHVAGESSKTDLSLFKGRENPINGSFLW